MLKDGIDPQMLEEDEFLYHRPAYRSKQIWIDIEDLYKKRSWSSEVVAGTQIEEISDLSTADFMRKLFKQNFVELEGSNLPVLLCNDPQLKQELGLGIKLQSSSEKGDCVSNVLKEKIIFLEDVEACCICMPCHVSHAWYEELLQVCSIPFLHMGDCVAQELKEVNLRSIKMGSNVKIGLLGTESTMTAGFLLGQA